MTLIPENLLGAVIDPHETEAVCDTLAGYGKEPLFSQARPELGGYGEGKTVLLFEAEQKLFGKLLPSWDQGRGTCVGQGFGRAWQDALWWAIAFGNKIGKPLQIAYETLYSGSRINVGKGELGRGDGSIGAWAALFGHDFGLLPRGVYGTIDLSKPREDLAVLWGEPKRGCPVALVDRSSGYKADGCMKCESVDDVRDALASGYGVARCAKRATKGLRDKNGYSSPQPSGGHCQELRGVFEDIDGDLGFIEQQSWGSSGPQGGGPLKLSDGREVDLPEGACAIRPEWVQTYLKEGEIWAVAPPFNLWKELP